MGISEILPHIYSLEHVDKLRLMQTLLTEIAKDEGVSLEAQAEKAEVTDAKNSPSSFGKHLRTLREKALQEGQSTLDWDGIEAEVRTRRGDKSAEILCSLRT